jgi:hypothetical protein
LSDVSASQLGRNQVPEIVSHGPTLRGGEVFERRPAVGIDPHARRAI